MASLSLRGFLFLLRISISALLCSGQPLPSPTAFNTSVAAGQGVNLVCSLVGYSRTGPLSITIMKVSDPTANSATLTSEGVENVTVILSIEATRLEDSGMYRCTASTAIGEIMSETVFFNLEVRDEFALITPLADTIAQPGGNAVFSCNFNSLLVVSWFRGTSQQPLSQDTSKYLFSEVGKRVLTITDVTYSDMGSYVCQVTDNFMPVRHSASLTLVPAYVPLMRQVGLGQSTIVTRDQLKIDCREYIAGVPGASLIYWQRDIVIDPRNVTSRGSNGDPFVDEQGRLDFSAAGVEDEGRYRCTAVDELGVQVEQEFYVEVTHVTGFYLWNQWYMILVYCVVVVAILAIIVLAIWFSFSVKFNFCVKAKKVVRKKERVRRSERKLVYMTSVTDEGIDAYAMNYDEEDGEEVHETHDEEATHDEEEP